MKKITISKKSIALMVLTFFVVIGSNFAIYRFGYNNGFKFGNAEGQKEGYDMGYSIGRTPTEAEVKAGQVRAAVAQDMFDLAENYRKSAQLCESKYQSALDGDYYNAFQYKGQETEIQNKIDEILTKYEDNGSGW